MGLDRVSQREIPVHAISIAPALSLALQITARLEIGHDPLHRTLGDADAIRRITKPKFRILGQQKENVGVIAEEGPPPRRGLFPGHARFST